MWIGFFLQKVQEIGCKTARRLAANDLVPMEETCRISNSQNVFGENESKMKMIHWTKSLSLEEYEIVEAPISYTSSLLEHYH